MLPFVVEVEIAVEAFVLLSDGGDDCLDSATPSATLCTLCYK